MTAAVAGRAGFEAVNLRIGAIWGPRGRAASAFFAVPGLVNAAVPGEPLLDTVYAGDGSDILYAPDCGRAIALLQTAGKLNHRTYNIGSGRVTTNAEVLAAIRKVIPDAPISLAEGRSPSAPGEDFYLDTTRLHDDTGFTPAHQLEAAVADHIGSLRG